MQMHSEEKLIELVKEGDISAFEELYDKYSKIISRFVYQYTGNTQDTEEIVQEIFLKLFVSIRKYSKREGVTFLSWFMRVSINTSLNYIKKERSGKMICDQNYIKIVNEGQTASGPEEILEHTELENNIVEALKELSLKQKMVFVLKHFQGLSIPEIALNMKCSEGSVRKQLYRSVSKIRINLKIESEGVKNV